MSSAPRFERVEGGASLVHTTPWRAPARVAVAFAVGMVAVVGLALGPTAAAVASPLLLVALALAWLRRRHVLTIRGGVLAWRSTLGTSGQLRMADVLELEQHGDHVQFRLRDGRVARAPFPGPSVATSTFLSFVRQARS